MPDASVIDTNVLIVASAADDGSVFPAEGTPVARPEDRATVLNWLADFERDESRHVVLDWHWHLCSEYQNKLHPAQDYGWLVILAKQDRNQVAWVGLEVDEHGHAVLEDPLSSAVVKRDHNVAWLPEANAAMTSFRTSRPNSSAR